VRRALIYVAGHLAVLVAIGAILALVSCVSVRTVDTNNFDPGTEYQVLVHKEWRW
jgi:hypothetical protein